MSLTPAQNDKETRQRREAIELCGRNRGPHDYMPIEWLVTATSKRVTRMLCRICFTHIEMANLLENYPEVKL